MFDAFRCRLLLGTMLGAAALATPFDAHAQQRTHKFNVPAQGMDGALKAIASQSGEQVIFEGAAVRGKRSAALAGTYSADEAIAIVLRGSGLGVRRSPRGVLVVSPSVAEGAQMGNGPAADEAASDDDRGRAEILVVGSRSQNVDIRRTEDDPQPYVVFDKTDIAKSQAVTVEDFLKTRLPMNAQATQLNQAGTFAPTSDVSNINLRGIGSKQTLILIDGRRAPRLLAGGTSFNQADINGIPLSAIERIEVLPSTAGGIYGGDAVGGVINIIRKRDYRGVDVRMDYGGAFRGGAEAFRIGLNGGFSPDRGKTQVTFSLSQTNTRPLYQGDNNLALRGRQLYYANNGAALLGLDAGSTPNIVSVMVPRSF